MICLKLQVYLWMIKITVRDPFIGGVLEKADKRLICLAHLGQLRPFWCPSEWDPELMVLDKVVVNILNWTIF